MTNRRDFIKTSAFVCALPSMLLTRSVYADMPRFMTIGGGPSGGVFNIVSSSIASILKKENPKMIIDVQPGGSGPNLLRVGSGKADLGITSVSNAVDVWNGRLPTTEDKPIQNIRSLMALMSSAVQIWVDADSDIYSIEDLKGKQVSAGQPGQTSWVAFEQLLGAANMSIADIEEGGGKLHKLSWAESQNALRDGQLDAVMWLALVPHPTIRQNETVRPMRALSLSDEVIEGFLEKNPGFEKFTLPKGIFGGQKEEAHTVSTNTILFASDKMSDEVAYKIVKEIMENQESLKKVHALLSNFSLDYAVQGMGLPVHEGAMKYYREQGIDNIETVL